MTLSRTKTGLAWMLLVSSIAIGKDHAPLKYLAKDAIDVMALLPAPPATGSQEEQAELAQVLAVQAARSAEDVARAKAEDKLTVFTFADVLGKDFSAERCPKSAALFADVESDAKAVGRIAKEHWNRPRPPYVSDKVHPVVELEQEGSYPSGHSTRAMVYALVLAEIFPEHRDALLLRAQQISWDRVIGGVHYPTDVSAGRVLGQAIAEKLVASHVFVEALGPIKAELHEQLAQPTALLPVRSSH